MKRVEHVRQEGMTLIELMIAVTLGLNLYETIPFITVIGAFVLLFANSKQSYSLNENLARLQENGRFAMHLLSRDLRWADYRACVTQDLLDNAITGTNDSGLNSSDTVTIVFQSNDCAAAASTVTMAYSVQAGVDGGPSLFRSIDGGTAQELVEDIDNLQILYGEDTDNDDVPNYYVAYNSITDPEQIVSVRLTVTARTPEVSLAAGGGRLTRDFTSTIVLRNRVP